MLCQKKSGALSVRAACSKKETGVDPVALGLQGPKGDKGDQGAPGALATALWAVVNTDGTLARGSGVTSSASLGTGQYEVIFNRDVTSCAYVTSAGNPGIFTPPARMGGTAARFQNANGIFIELFDNTGASVDASFHVAAFCP